MAAPRKRQRRHSQDGGGGERVEMGVYLLLALSRLASPTLQRNTISQGSLKAENLKLEYTSSGKNDQDFCLCTSLVFSAFGIMRPRSLQATHIPAPARIRGMPEATLGEDRIIIKGKSSPTSKPAFPQPHVPVSCSHNPPTPRRRKVPLFLPCNT